MNIYGIKINKIKIKSLIIFSINIVKYLKAFSINNSNNGLLNNTINKELFKRLKNKNKSNYFLSRLLNESKEENESTESIYRVSYLQIFEFIVLFLIIILVVLSIYYRRYVDRYGIEPFKVPFYVPNIIFPRPSNNPLLRTTAERNLNRIFGDSIDYETRNTHKREISFEIILKANSNSELSKGFSDNSI